MPRNEIPAASAPAVARFIAHEPASGRPKDLLDLQLLPPES
jgi:hypothetical protein